MKHLMNGTTFGFFKLIWKSGKEYLHYFFLPLFCLSQKSNFLKSVYRLSVESRALYLKTVCLATENSYYARKLWCLLCKDSVMSPSAPIKMSFTKTTKICRKMLVI